MAGAMFLYLLAFVGGILTIVSPCILPVLPLVFSRADQPFRRSGLPLLAGMAAAFAVVAGVATFAGAWIVRANQIGRLLAIVVFAVLGLALLFPTLAEYLTRPSHGFALLHEFRSHEIRQGEMKMRSRGFCGKAFSGW
jgi:cytochrome c biogenesis protein CcdA